MPLEWLRPYEMGHETQPAVDHRCVEQLLRTLREHLSMDVAFVSEITGGQRIFRYVETGGTDGIILTGDVDTAESTYCGLVLAGVLPELLVDPTDHLVPASERAGGSRLTVPIVMSDGTVFGTLCCFSSEIRSVLNQGHVAAMRMMAQLAGEYLEVIDRAERHRLVRHQVVEAVLQDPNGMEMVFQPLRDLESMDIVAIEALARFPGRDFGPEWFFAEATAHDRGVDLETRAVRLALSVLDRVPEPIRLNVNVSPVTLQSQPFFDAVVGVAPDRLVVEVTEHAVVDDYNDMRRAMARLAALGVRLAIDDVGMGFSGLNRILESSPHELKLDASVIMGVDTSTVKQALVEAFSSFGRRAGFDVVAEGVETHAQRQCLRQLGVRTGQGYHLGRPDRLHAVLPSARLPSRL